jgi:hypothetical protein
VKTHSLLFNPLAFRQRHDLAVIQPSTTSVLNILKCGLDRQPSLFPATSSPAIEHENVRGPDYYGHH